MKISDRRTLTEIRAAWADNLPQTGCIGLLRHGDDIVGQAVVDLYLSRTLNRDSLQRVSWAAIQVGRDTVVHPYEPFNLDPPRLNRLSFDAQRVSKTVAFRVNLLHMSNLLPNDAASIIARRHGLTVHVSGKLIPQIQQKTDRQCVAALLP